MKAILVIDIPEEAIGKYKNFYVDYRLIGETDYFYTFETIKSVEDVAITPIECNPAREWKEYECVGETE